VQGVAIGNPALTFRWVAMQWCSHRNDSMTQDKEPRRRFLRQMLAVVPTATLASGAAVTESACDKSAVAQASGGAPEYQPTFFNPAQWTFLHAALDRLIPSDQYGPGAVETNVPEYIDRQMETPYGHGKLRYSQGPFHPDAKPEFGLQMNLTPRDIYQHGIAECDDWCKKMHGDKTFASLDHPTQEQVLSDLEHGKIELATVPAKVFFGYLLANTKEGFFADPIYGGNKNMGGWKMIGFPGARADFADWIDQPNTKYPYGPVSISGERG
jgi:gluconate 2-dehydrogenase gamma chain